jgi:glycosyltransferase involved in cell wall biosynthesis
MLPLYPAAVADLSKRLAAMHAERAIDLVISSSSAAIKGLEPPAGVPHLCYCHAPARYVWSQQDAYGGPGLAGALRRAGLKFYGPRFKRWDRSTLGNVSRFVANSTHTARQLRESYGVAAGVVPPPVRTEFFTPDPEVKRERFWLVVSALEPYKRVDLAVSAAVRTGIKLVIAGDGTQRQALERLASGRVRFVGRVSDEDLRKLYRTAAVLMFPQVEDFGIVAVEAQACGLPVVARRAGGATDIVVEGKTGAFFDEPTQEAIMAAVASLPPDCARACRSNAMRFSEAVFDSAMGGLVRTMLAEREEQGAGAR